MKYLKYKSQSIFPMWGRVKLNFRDRYEKPNIYSKNSSHCQVFFTGLSKNDFGNCKLCKLVMGTPPVMPPIMSDAPHLFFVYQMGRLCGGAHEISGIKAPIFLHGWVGVVEWVVVGWVGVGRGGGGRVGDGGVRVVG